MHRIVQVVLVQFKASTHKERGRPRDWRLGPMKVQQQRRDASQGTALFCCRSGNRGRILPRQILFVKCAFYSGPVADLGGTLSQDVASTKSGWGRVYWSHTKRTALFCCRTWPRPPWAHKPPDGLLVAHERNGAVLLQNAAPTPLSTHEHSRVRFSILIPGQGPQP